MAVPSMSESSSCSGGEEFLCDYEKQRLENIKENQEMLKMLGQYLSITELKYSSFCCSV